MAGANRKPGGASSVSRRTFLAATGVAATALTADLAAAATKGDATPPWAGEADVIVVGSGAAGYTAAICAARRGAEVLMLEKAGMAGGTTAKSGGVWWTPNNSLMRKAGLEDPREDAVRLMARLSFPNVYNPSLAYLGLDPGDHALIEAFYDFASVASDELDELGALKFTFGTAVDGQRYPDYFGDFPEDKALRGRCLAPLAPNGQSAGSGAEMIRQLGAAADRMGIRLLLEHGVNDVITNPAGEVCGVSAVNGAEAKAFRARKAVIFASGGFTHNAKLVKDYLLGPISGGCAVPTNTGDVIAIATKLGAELGNMKHAWWAQTVFEQALVSPSVPTDVFYYPSGSMFLVNRYGHRVVNEKSMYNERAQVHFTVGSGATEYPNYLLYMIYDQRLADDVGSRRFPYPMPPKGASPPYVISGSTLDDLGRKLQDRLAALTEKYGLASSFTLDEQFSANLAATRERFNGFARRGIDLDFRRGERLVDRSYEPAVPNGMPNPTMYPMADEGPYHCIIIAPGTLDTKGGPKINPKAQMLDADSQPIAGLYGAGNCIAAPSGQAYWSGGGTLSPAIAFGYLAGVHAAAEPVKPV